YTETPKILSLADPTKKMSKSLGEKHHINIFGDENIIKKQVKTAVTDTGEIDTKEMSPGVKNLFEIIKACQKLDQYQTLMNDYTNGQLKYSALKEIVSDALVELITPIRENYQEISSNKKEHKEQIRASSAVIRNRAKQTLQEVREIVGLTNLK
ncbi:MAG: tryptophan--tRNA ligase, partial [Saprospiraceae bacterium]